MMTDKHLPTARVLFKNIFPKVLFFLVNVVYIYSSPLLAEALLK